MEITTRLHQNDRNTQTMINTRTVRHKLVVSVFDVCPASALHLFIFRFWNVILQVRYVSLWPNARFEKVSWSDVTHRASKFWPAREGSVCCSLYQLLRPYFAWYSGLILNSEWEGMWNVALFGVHWHSRGVFHTRGALRNAIRGRCCVLGYSCTNVTARPGTRLEGLRHLLK